MEWCGYRPLCPIGVLWSMPCTGHIVPGEVLEKIWGRQNFGTCREMVTMVGTCHYVMVFMDLHNGQVDLHNGPVDLHNSLLYPL
jgi:hypothetical protein